MVPEARFELAGKLVALTRIELVIKAYQASVIPFNYRAVSIPRKTSAASSVTFIFCFMRWRSSMTVRT